MHRNDVRVRVRQVAASEQERHARDAVNALHRNGEFLAECDGQSRKVGRHIVEIAVVLLRHDQGVAWPDRANTEKRDELIVLVKDMRRDAARGDATEVTIGAHVGYRRVVG
jgi:hypothetical protein